MVAIPRRVESSLAAARSSRIVSDLSQVLRLLRDSPSLWRTLRAEGFEWTDPELFETAFGKGFEATGSASGSRRSKPPSETRSARGAVGVRPASARNSRSFNTTSTWKVWIERPDRFRSEVPAGAGVVSTVWHGDAWWSLSPEGERRSSDGQANAKHAKGPSELLVETQVLLGTLMFEDSAEASLLGRDVLQVRAKPRAQPRLRRLTLRGLGIGADDYVLSVDAERGIVLRSEARLSEQSFKVIEMTAVSFDITLPSEIFAPP